MKLVAQAAKAFVAAATAALAVLAGYLVNNTSLGDVTGGQWVLVAGAALTAGLAVYGVKNATP